MRDMRARLDVFASCNLLQLQAPPSFCKIIKRASIYQSTFCMRNRVQSPTSVSIPSFLAPLLRYVSGDWGDGYAPYEEALGATLDRDLGPGWRTGYPVRI
jgi:hypothetical protein